MDEKSKNEFVELFIKGLDGLNADYNDIMRQQLETDEEKEKEFNILCRDFVEWAAKELLRLKLVL